MLKFPIIRVLCVIIFLTNNEILMVNTTDNNNNKEIFPVKINLPLINNNNNNLMRIKRGEIDLPTCIENFNVHRDKIIRTQDSQKMGAKYLTEMDLGSREECLRLCCETEECDVFVYEEKNSGSCYLFQCGPPEDFKCKFTHHVNYSSAILSISRHYFSADLENQIKLTKHIDELNRLSRKPAFSSSSSDLNNNNNNLKFIPTSSSSSSTIAPILINKEIIPSTSIIIDKTETSRTKCLRYQFECRSNSECIAIYNVCDGIPQCADGSDEANELGCPAPEAVASVTVQTTPSNILTVKSAKNLLEYGREGELVQQQQQQQQSISNYQPILHASSSMQQEQDYPGNSRKVQFEQIAPNYWSQSRGIKLNQQIPQFQEAAGFSAVNRIEKSNFQQYPEYPSRISNYYKNNNNNQPIPLPQENWRLLSENDPFHQQQQQLLYNSKDSAPILPAKSEGTDNMDNIEEFNSQNIINNKKPSVKQLDFSKELTNPPHIQDKLAHDLKQSKDKMTHGSVQKTKIIKIENLKSPQQESYKMIEDNNIKDGHSVVPKGALLSLTLGLILTGIMAILIGCRLRGVKQRLLRKGGKGYAHDADYLVNGMYL